MLGMLPGMGTSIVLDPLDIYRMSAGLNVSFEGMIDQVIELNVVDGVILPNLKMDGDEEACVFLDDGEDAESMHSGRGSAGSFRWEESMRTMLFSISFRSGSVKRKTGER